MEKTLQERIEKLKEDRPDFGNVEEMASDVWLFLTNDYMPDKAMIKKEALLHEVSAMLETARQFYARKQSIEFQRWCDRKGVKINNETEMYILTAEGYTIYTNEQVYGLFLDEQATLTHSQAGERKIRI